MTGEDIQIESDSHRESIRERARERLTQGCGARFPRAPPSLRHLHAAGPRVGLAVPRAPRPVEVESERVSESTGAREEDGEAERASERERARERESERERDLRRTQTRLRRLCAQPDQPLPSPPHPSLPPKQPSRPGSPSSPAERTALAGNAAAINANYSSGLPEDRRARLLGQTFGRIQTALQCRLWKLHGKHTRIEFNTEIECLLFVFLA